MKNTTNLYDILNARYYEIIQKHNNPVYARKELEYLIRNQSWWGMTLNEQEQKDIDDYFDALVKIHGGN